jgi:hypothetical protein
MSEEKKKRYLSKSRFTMALECPTKLFYTGKTDYQNNSDSDEFLRALAQGGFQVGELAKYYYPGGHEIEGLDIKKNLKETDDLIKKNEDVSIFEATVAYKDLLVKVDILNKVGNVMELIEVKAKSMHSASQLLDEACKSKDTKVREGAYAVNSDWKKYLYDVAFQTYVLEKRYPHSEIKPFLMLADKSKKATVDGLNQYFRINKDKNGRTFCVARENLSAKELGQAVLTKVDVSKIVRIILDSLDMNEDFSVLNTESFPSAIKNDPELIEKFKKLPQFEETYEKYTSGGRPIKKTWKEKWSASNNFERYINFLSYCYSNNIKIETPVGSKCKECQFRCDYSTMNSGFHECWEKVFKKNGGYETNKERLLVYDLWDIRNSNKHFDSGVYYLDELTEELIKSKDSKSGSIGFDRLTRQLEQIEKYKNKDVDPTYLFDEMAVEFNKIIDKPINMIDFETSTAGIPFHKGRRPYETIAFQFSHHIIYPDGRIEHANQYICAEPGKFPNFEFATALMNALNKNDGPIFMYSTHENSVCNQILKQLGDLTEVEQKQYKDEIEFLRSITIEKDKKTKVIIREGERAMIDLYVWVKKYYYHPAMGGSNSIKVVLPAILNESKYLQEKYSKSIYGGKNAEINSLNFNKPKSWIHIDSTGKVVDPYKSLDPIFDKNDPSLAKVEWVTDDEKGQINNGGAAMTAFGKIQFTEMSDVERQLLVNALLRYCELDTMAMVFIFEHWKNLLKEKGLLNIIEEEAS